MEFIKKMNFIGNWGRKKQQHKNLGLLSSFISSTAMHGISYKLFCANKGMEGLCSQQAHCVGAFCSCFLLLCYSEWIIGVFCPRGCPSPRSSLNAIALGIFCHVFRRETVKKDWSVMQTLFLSRLGKITLCLVQLSSWELPGVWEAVPRTWSRGGPWALHLWGWILFWLQWLVSQQVEQW